MDMSCQSESTQKYENEDEEDDDYDAGIITERAEPINPAEWVKIHSEFLNHHQHHHHNDQQFTSDTSSSILSSTEQESSYETLLYDPQVAAHQKLLPNLSIQTSMRTMIKTAQQRHSGLKIRDRQWLRMVIYAAFLGADLVDW